METSLLETKSWYYINHRLIFGYIWSFSEFANVIGAYNVFL